MFKMVEAARNKYDGRHYATMIPSTKNKGKPQTQCLVCTLDVTRKEGQYQCQKFLNQSDLCFTPCYEQLHKEEKRGN